MLLQLTLGVRERHVAAHCKLLATMANWCTCSANTQCAYPSVSQLVVKLPASGGGEPPRTPRGSLAGTALRDGTASGSGMTHGSHDGRGAQQHPHAGAHGHHSKGHHGHGHGGHSGSQRPAGGSGGSAEEQGPGQGDGEWGLGMAAAGAVSRLRGLPHFNRAARARKLDLAVLGPGDV